MNYFKLFAISCFFTLNAYCDLLNLNKMNQGFILETKRIIIPEYPTAFNPTIIRWKKKLLLCFRIRDPITLSTDRIGLTWLTDNLDPIGTPYILNRADEHCHIPSFAQDPRLIEVNHQLYMIYSNLFDDKNNIIRRVVIGKIHFDGDNFTLKSSKPIFYFDGADPKKQEKNWVPFLYKNKLRFSYSLNPHLVMTPQPCTYSTENLAYSKGIFQWHWGDLRGGTPASLVDGQYLAFFHCSKGLSTVQSKGQLMTHYFMGAYTFSQTPPFEITSVSPEPLMHETFYKGEMYKTWKPIRVVFPCGFIHDPHFIWIAYGRQDHEMWVAKLDKALLLASLKPIKPESN